MIEWAEPWMAIPAVLLVHFGLRRLTSSNTEAGRRLRASEHLAWQMEMERQQQKLDELRSAEPRSDL